MIGSTLKNILQQRKTNANELAKQINVSPQTLYSIIKRDNMKIDFDLLLKICDELDVPVELFYGEDSSTNVPEIRELDILAKYRKLDEHGREITELVMDTELTRIEAAQQEKVAAKKVIPLYYTPAAAGYASPALGEDYEDYEVAADSKADFAAHIQGDSMEPYIPDGSIVLVQRGNTLSAGDVGLFFVDGDMKCKQYCQDITGTIYLFSLNRARSDADVVINASSGITLLCLGKVLLPKKPPLPVD
jgi:repressor LexA